MALSYYIAVVAVLLALVLALGATPTSALPLPEVLAWEQDVAIAMRTWLRLLRERALYENIAGGTTTATFAPTSLNYYLSAALSAEIAVALAVVGTIVGIVAWCVRARRRCNCGVLRPRGYTRVERYVPVVVLSVTTACAAGAVFFAAIGDQAMGVALHSLMQQPANLSAGLQDRVLAIQGVLEGLNNSIATDVESIHVQASGFRDIAPFVVAMANDVANVSDAFEELYDTMVALDANMTIVAADLAALAAVGTVPGVPSGSAVPSVPDDVLDMIDAAGVHAAIVSGVVQILAGALQENIDGVVDDIDNELDTLANEAIGTLSAVDTQLGDIGGVAQSLRDSVAPYAALATQYEPARFWGLLAPLLLTTLAVTVTMVFGWTQRHRHFVWCAQCQGCQLGLWGLVLWFLAWLWFAVLFTMALVVAGACVTFVPQLLLQPEIPLPAQLRNQSQQLVTCTAAQSASGAVTLYTVFGVQQYLNISAALNLGGLQSSLDINGRLNLTDYLLLFQEMSEVGALNLTDVFGAADPAPLATQLRALRDNLTIEMFGGSATLLAQAQQNLTRDADILDAAPGALAQAAAVNVAVNSSNAAVAAEVQGAQTLTAQLAANLTASLAIIGALQTQADALVPYGDCGWIGTAWATLQQASCTALPAQLDLLWFAYFVCGVLLLPSMIAGCTLSTRAGMTPTRTQQRLEAMAARLRAQKHDPIELQQLLPEGSA